MIELSLVTILLAFCSITYELLLANALSIMLGDPVFWQSMTIGIFIAGLGVGAATAERKNLNSYSHLFKVELWLTLLGALSILILYVNHGAFRIVDYVGYRTSLNFDSVYSQISFVTSIIFFAIVELITFSIGLLSGFEIPILFRILENKIKEKSNQEIANSNNKILALNYGGTLLGTLAFAYLLKPYLDIFMSALLAAFLNLALCIFIFFKKKNLSSSYNWKAGIPIVLLLILIIGLGINASSIEQNYLKIYYRYKKGFDVDPDVTKFLSDIDKYPKVDRRRSLYQYIDIYKVQAPERPAPDTIMTLDTHFQFSTYNERYYHEAFAHLPMIFTKTVPKKVLVLGAGDGLLIRDLLKHPEIESILHIELDAMVLKMAKEEKFLRELNEDSLSHPKVKTIISDGFYFLRNNNQKYDAIFIDFPHPNNYDLSRLYSVEFYSYVKKNLAPHGFAVFDAPIIDEKDYTKGEYAGRIVVISPFTEREKEVNSILLSTVHYAGFETVFPYRVTEESFILMTNNPEPFNFELSEEDKKYLNVLDRSHMLEISRQEFPHDIAKEHINSIFYPKISHQLDF